MTSNESTTSSGKETPEFSRPFNLEKVSAAAPYRLELTATPKECSELAKRIGVDGIHHLNATFMIKRQRGKSLFASADVKADVLESTPSNSKQTTNFEFEIKLHLVEGKESEAEELIDWEKELVSEYDLEFYQNSTIDFGEIISQYLALEILLPLPSEEDEEESIETLLEAEESHKDEQEKINPFAVLERLKK